MPFVGQPYHKNNSSSSSSSSSSSRSFAAPGNNLIQINQPLAAATQSVFKTCTTFKNCITEINVTFELES